MSKKPSLKRLTSTSALRPFDCNDTDLNDFFYDDALNQLRELLAVTYVLENEDETVAYFSVLNDKISREDPKTQKRIRKLEKLIPHGKKYSSYPAVKIGRFAVHTKYQNQKTGRMLIDFIKAYFITKNKTGCRFITADAYEDAFGFYQRNGFEFLTESDKGEDTRLMYFDLTPFRK